MLQSDREGKKISLEMNGQEKIPQVHADPEPGTANIDQPD